MKLSCVNHRSIVDFSLKRSSIKNIKHQGQIAKGVEIAMIPYLKVATILFFISQVTLADDTSPLTYQYITPYSGGASLILTNHGKDEVNISKLAFTNNAGIAGTPWGTLWGFQSKIQTTALDDGVNTRYVIIENPVVKIPPSGTAVLTYNINRDKMGGPLSPNNAAMDSIDVSVTRSNSGLEVSVPIEGKCQDAACDDPGQGKRIMGYYPDWAYWRTPQFTVDKLPFDKINALAYAFSIFDKNGNVSLYDADSDAFNLPLISQARLKYPYLNASLSFGGWSWASKPKGWLCDTGASPNGPANCFKQLAADSASTALFVQKAVKAMKEVHFNSIDIDWEYPLQADAENYVHLLQQLRSALDEQGKQDGTHYFLTIAAPAGINKIHELTATQWKTIATTVDYIDVMTYDFHGDWDKGQVGSDFMSAMALDPTLDPTFNHPILGKYNVIDALEAYVNLGVPKNKLVVGIPVYGRMMNIKSTGPSKGLYQPITGTPQGEWDNQQSGMTGMVDYACIVDQSACGNNYILPPLTLVAPTDNNLGQYALTPWGYAANLFITYDDDKSATYKANWILENNYAGVMLWDLTGDFTGTDERSIVNAIFQVFHQ